MPADGKVARVGVLRSPGAVGASALGMSRALCFWGSPWRETLDSLGRTTAQVLLGKMGRGSG